MNVTVTFSPYLISLTKTQQIVLNLEEGSCLKDLLEVLVTLYGKGIIERLFTPTLGPAEPTEVTTSVIVDGLIMPLKPESNIKLKEGSKVNLIAPVAGG